jgi:hypothetical protein
MAGGLGASRLPSGIVNRRHMHKTKRRLAAAAETEELTSVLYFDVARQYVRRQAFPDAKDESRQAF